MKIMTITLNALPDLTSGRHESRESGVCAMEAVAWLAGEPHTDHPVCVCPPLAEFVRRLNDTPDGHGGQRVRDALKPLLPRMIGTAGDGRRQERALLAADWIIRTCTPAWLRLAGLTAEADALAGLDRVVAWGDVERAMPFLRRAADAAHKGADAPWDVAWAAARNAAWETARATARAASGAARWDASGAAHWDAAWAAAWAASWDAALVAAARDAAAWAASWDAAAGVAWGALTSTVTALQDSALGLLEQMLPEAAA